MIDIWKEDMHMPVITKHGREKLHERINLMDKGADRITKRALKHGIKHSETYGELKSWLSGKYLSRHSANDLRIYKNNLFVFCNSILVTVYPLPEKYAEMIEECVDPDALEIYKNYINEQDNAKSTKKQDKKDKKYNEKKQEFFKSVLLYDVRSFADGKYNSKISGVSIDADKVIVRYIPYRGQREDLYGIIGYLRENTNFRSIRLVHAVGRDGKPAYVDGYDYDPYKARVVYQA